MHTDAHGHANRALEIRKMCFGDRLQDEYMSMLDMYRRRGKDSVKDRS